MVKSTFLRFPTLGENYGTTLKKVSKPQIQKSLGLVGDETECYNDGKTNSFFS